MFGVLKYVHNETYVTLRCIEHSIPVPFFIHIFKYHELITTTSLKFKLCNCVLVLGKRLTHSQVCLFKIFPPMVK